MPFSIRLCRNTVKNKTQFILNYHIYLYLYIHIQAYGLGPFFKLSLGKQKKCFIICHHMWIRDKPSVVEEITQNEPKTFLSSTANKSQRQQKEQHDATWDDLSQKICMNNITIVCFLAWCNELTEQRLQWEWHQLKSQWKQRSCCEPQHTMQVIIEF